MEVSKFVVDATREDDEVDAIVQFPEKHTSSQ